VEHPCAGLAAYVRGQSLAHCSRDRICLQRFGCRRDGGNEHSAGSKISRSVERTSVLTRPQKVTLAEMRDTGVRGILVYCADFRCSHSIAISGDRWPDELRLSDLEPRFTCSACGKRGADVRPDFNCNGQAVR
jgi:hypothetical protein